MQTPVERLLARAAAGDYGRVDHVLVLHGDAVLMDEALHEPSGPDTRSEGAQYDYDDPAWHPYLGASSLHTLQSVTKSVTAIGVGMAIDEGHIPGASTPIERWLPVDTDDLDADLRRQISLADLLTMRSGLAWDEGRPYSDPENTCTQLEASDDWIDFIARRPMREAPGTRFDYNSGASVLLGKVVREATGERIDRYLQTRLFEPLGISTHHWKTTPRGEADTEGGLYLRAEDLAKIGRLLLDGGRWNERQLLSQAWIDAMLATHVTDIVPGSADAYGYQWWVPDATIRVVAGLGFGGQFLLLVPELDVVVVIYAWNPDTPPARSLAGDIVSELLPTLARP